MGIKIRDKIQVKTYLKKFLSENIGCFFACLIVGVVCCIYSGSLANKAMAPSEGWYSYYASLINEKGAVPYVDFELLFPPLYTYLIALITKIFGYKIIVLRICGVMVYTLTGIFACLIFNKLFKKPFLGVLGGLTAIAFVQSESAQVFYDYIRFMDLSVYVSVYFFLRYFDKPSEKAINVDLLSGTIFAVLASMYKQSSGLIFLFFCLAVFIFILIFLPGRKNVLKDLFVVLSVCVIMYAVLFLFLAGKGAFKAYCYYNFKASVGAKGGGNLISILFGWFSRGKNLILHNTPWAALAAFVVAVESFFSRKQQNVQRHPRLEWIGLIVVALLAILAVVLCLSFQSYAGVFKNWDKYWRQYVSFLFAGILFFVTALLLIFHKKIKIQNKSFIYKYFYASGAAFILAYAVSTSGGLGESQVALCLALLVTSFAGIARFPRKEIIAVVTAIYMLFDISVSFSVKTFSVYSWWGLEVGSYWEQTSECEIPILKGIKMSDKYAQMYNHVYYNVIENTDEEDEIFVFPHMPIFYLATEREKATFTAVQWFDVSTDEKVVSDIDAIKKKEPKIMVLCFISDYVCSSHEASFRNGEKSGLSIFQEFLKEFLAEKEYVLLSSDTISSDYTVEVYSLPEKSGGL